MNVCGLHALDWTIHDDCPYCTSIRISEKDTEIERLTRERDEARDAARAGYAAMFRPMNWAEGERARMLMQWPWLKMEETVRQ